MTSIESRARKPPRPTSSRSEVRDGMRIDWDVPITMDDGLVLRADVFRPVKDGRYPVILTYGPYAKGLAFQDGYPSAWQRMAEKHPDVTAGSSNLYQSWEVVDPGEVGAARLCLRARRFPRRRLLAGLHRSFLAARDQGLLRLHRMGRRAAVVERQGRAQRHLVLRHQPVARRVAAAAASRRHVHLGGRRRLVPRHDAPRRHPLHVLGKLVRHAGQDRAVRRGRARQALARCTASWCAGRRPCRRTSWRRTAATSATRSSPIRSTTTITRRARRSGRRSRRRCSPPPTGAASRCIRAAISRASCAPPRKDKWLEVHGIEHWTHFYTDYGRELQLRFFDHFLHGKDNGWDKQPRVLLQVRHPARRSSSAPRTNGRSSARSGRSSISTRANGALTPKTSLPARRAQSFDAMGDGVTFLTEPLAEENRDHRAVGARSCSCRHRPRTPTCSWCCACSPAT